jgi:hypothetical protein
MKSESNKHLSEYEKNVLINEYTLILSDDTFTKAEKELARLEIHDLKKNDNLLDWIGST